MYTKIKHELFSLTTAIIFIIIVSLIVSPQVYAQSRPYYYKLENAFNNTKTLTTPKTNDQIILKEDIVLFNDVLAENLKVKVEQEVRQKVLTTVQSNRAVTYNEINVYTDLSVMNTITTDEMNQIIDYWNRVSGGDSPFVGYGQTFIDASKETGLDPIYLLAHAGLESSWGKSHIARDKHNYFGIGAFDSSPYESAYSMGDDVSQGIMEGAMWIDDNYYEEGQTSLYTMRYNNGTHEYCTSTTWMYNISSIMQTSYSLIQS